MAITLVLFAVATIAPALADSSVTRDTDSTPGASVPTTGTRLSMYRGFRLGSCSDTDPNIAPGATTFQANSPFFVRHGWVGSINPPVQNQTYAAFQRPTTTFYLYVDGVLQSSLPDFYSPSSQTHVKLFVTNFGNGMTGTHIFKGWWFLDGYLLGGTPNTEVFQLACNLQITFQ